MSEVTFAKSFLATIDKRQVKLPADHVSDPRKYPSQSPYILPKQTHPFPRKTGPTTTQQAQAKTITATLKPLKAGETVALSDITLDTTVYEIKSQYAQNTGLSQDKIKLLLNKKPTADLKTLKDLAVENNVEFSVMVMGGGSPTPSSQSPAVSTPPIPAPAESKGDPMDIDDKTGPQNSETAANEAADKEPSADTAAGVLRTEEFWTDLKGFLSQRLRDEKEGERLAGVFREAVGSKR